VREQHVMTHGDAHLRVFQSRRVYADDMAEIRDAPGFVLRQPVIDAIAQALRHDLRVVGEGVSSRARGPAALRLQRRRKIPVIQLRHGRNATRQQCINQALVEIQARLIERTSPIRKHAGPGDGETVGVQAHRRHQVDILLHSGVGSAGNIAVCALAYLPWKRREIVPDRRTSPINTRRALDLVRRCRRTPEKVGWQG
jgi:hypothetical protein